MSERREERGAREGEEREGEGGRGERGREEGRERREREREGEGERERREGGIGRGEGEGQGEERVRERRRGRRGERGEGRREGEGRKGFFKHLQCYYYQNGCSLSTVDNIFPSTQQHIISRDPAQHSQLYITLTVNIIMLSKQCWTCH